MEFRVLLYRAWQRLATKLGNPSEVRSQARAAQAPACMVLLALDFFMKARNDQHYVKTISIPLT